jgi:hypothetical protein
VAKTCPSCGYNPIGPFTDNCPICAEPVRNVRSDSARSAWPAGPAQWLRWGLTGGAALLVTVAGCCGLSMCRMGGTFQDAQTMMEKAREQAEAQRKARTVVVAAADVLQEFENDSAAADKKYKGKCLELSGIVERADKDLHGVPFVILHAGDEQAKTRFECFFDFDERDETQGKRFDKGQAITLRGEYGGRVSHIQLRGCVLVK